MSENVLQPARRVVQSGAWLPLAFPHREPQEAHDNSRIGNVDTGAVLVVLMCVWYAWYQGFYGMCGWYGRCLLYRWLVVLKCGHRYRACCGYVWVVWYVQLPHGSYLIARMKPPQLTNQKKNPI